MMANPSVSLSKVNTQEIAELNRRIEALLVDKDQASNNADLARAKQISAEGELRLTKEDLQTAHENIDSLQADLDAFNKALNEADDSETVINLENEIKALKSDKEDLLKSTQNQAGVIENMQRGLGNAIENYKEQSKQIADLNAAADDLENEIAKLKDDNNDLQQQLTYAQRAQDAAEKKATDLQAQYSAATAFIVTLLAR